MCEIAVIDPEQVPVEAAHQILGRFHEEQGDGIGVLAVKESPDGFTYDVHKSTTPHWQTFYSFFKRNYDSTWRFVLHGRAKTSGKVNRETAHPIRVDCEQCEFDYVVHNGSIRSYERKQENLIEDGHTLNTEVDSEVIAHKFGELPEDVSGLTNTKYRLYGNLNYLLFSEDGIVVRVADKYNMTGDFTLTCSADRYENPEELGFGEEDFREWALITPSDDGPNIDFKERTVSTRNRSATWPSDYRNQTTAAAGSRTRERSDETVVVEYTDHAQGWDTVTAVKVAPGVMRVTYVHDSETKYVKLEENPRLYYFYAPEGTPDNIGELEEMAGEHELIQSSLEDFPDDSVGEAVATAVSSTIARTVDGVEKDDILDAQEDVLDTARAAADAAVSAYQAEG